MQFARFQRDLTRFAGDCETGEADPADPGSVFAHAHDVLAVRADDGIQVEGTGVRPGLRRDRQLCCAGTGNDYRHAGERIAGLARLQPLIGVAGEGKLNAVRPPYTVRHDGQIGGGGSFDVRLGGSCAVGVIVGETALYGSQLPEHRRFFLRRRAGHSTDGEGQNRKADQDTEKPILHRRTLLSRLLLRQAGETPIFSINIYTMKRPG